jgi:hypothetical protein
MTNHSEVVAGLGDDELKRRIILAEQSIKNWLEKREQEGSEFHQENCDREIKWWRDHHFAVTQEIYKRGL